MASLVAENPVAVTKSSSSGGRRKAFFMFVRFQPPHSFHIELIRSTCEKALREGADVYVFVSPNNEPPNKNPIEYHKKIAKITFPLWLYVAVTGVVVYIMISPYY